MASAMASWLALAPLTAHSSVQRTALQTRPATGGPFLRLKAVLSLTAASHLMRTMMVPCLARRGAFKTRRQPLKSPQWRSYPAESKGSAMACSLASMFSNRQKTVLLSASKMSAASSGHTTTRLIIVGWSKTVNLEKTRML